MALSILQNTKSTAGVFSSGAGGLTPTLTWTSPTLGGSLLVALVAFNANSASVTCNMPGWLRAATIQNTSAQQAEIWYKNTNTANAKPPTFMVGSAIGVSIHIAEVRGFTSYVLDRTGTGTATNLATLTVAVSATTNDTGEFVIGGFGIGNTLSGVISATATTATGSATIGADINNNGADGATNSQGGNLAWETAGASGTSPGMAFNWDRATNVVVAGVVVSFVNGAQQGNLSRNNLRPHLFSPGLAR